MTTITFKITERQERLWRVALSEKYGKRLANLNQLAKIAVGEAVCEALTRDVEAAELEMGRDLHRANKDMKNYD